MVANQLESADHLANGEEAEALGSDDSASDELGSAEISGLAEEVLGGLDDGSVLDGLQQVLVGGLEGGDGAIRYLVSRELLRHVRQRGGILTEGSSSGRGRQSCQPRGRPWSSKRRRGLVLSNWLDRGVWWLNGCCCWTYARRNR